MPAREGKDLAQEHQHSGSLALLTKLNGKVLTERGFFCCCNYRKNVHANKINIELNDTTSPYRFEVIKCIKRYYFI